MAQPTVASRLQRRFALLGGDPVLEAALRAALPQGWEMRQVRRVEELGEVADVLQYRFLLVDLDDPSQGALAGIECVRRDLMLNIAIVCLGGDAAQRDAARLARADRFYGRGEAAGVMRQFCTQYDW